MTIICIIFGIMDILLFASVISLRDDLNLARRDIEHLKNWRMVQEHKQQITDTALDMLFVAVHGDVQPEVRH